MDQLDMPLGTSSSAFCIRRFKEVVVHKVSRVWVPLCLCGSLPIALFKELRQRLKDEFSKTGNQAFTIQSGQSGLSADLLQTITGKVFEERSLCESRL